MEIRNLAREHEYITAQKPAYLPWKKDKTPEETKTWLDNYRQCERYDRLLKGQMIWEMGTRVEIALKRQGIVTDYDLIRHTKKELLSFTNFGQGCLDAVVRVLSLHGYTLKEENNGN